MYADRVNGLPKIEARARTTHHKDVGDQVNMCASYCCWHSGTGMRC